MVTLGLNQLRDPVPFSISIFLQRAALAKNVLIKVMVSSAINRVTHYIEFSTEGVLVPVFPDRQSMSCIFV